MSRGLRAGLRRTIPARSPHSGTCAPKHSACTRRRVLTRGRPGVAPPTCAVEPVAPLGRPPPMRPSARSSLAWPPTTPPSPACSGRPADGSRVWPSPWVTGPPRVPRAPLGTGTGSRKAPDSACWPKVVDSRPPQSAASFHLAVPGATADDVNTCNWRSPPIHRIPCIWRCGQFTVEEPAEFSKLMCRCHLTEGHDTRRMAENDAVVVTPPGRAVSR
jgi:hypothetical protein